ncbi:hypothetical protein [Lapillicoccus jejuensis]|uniref:Uncharacterized protein n=1 Tax=Lapillicoccus jejuensis TaxID=402171 RepID=A0A542E4A1_9MICO|nr:hypothetical protein [Lapillicoccus jejuensis]TQJ10170.1 hypothetical protein FB458_3289 [Lapillicoccus jejuensis]
MTWDEVLDDLEHELTLDPLDPRRASGGWQPPTHLGPLPAALAPRARALLDRQVEQGASLRAALADTGTARRQAGREHEAARRLRAATATPPVPVYVDVVG